MYVPGHNSVDAGNNFKRVGSLKRNQWSFFYRKKILPKLDCPTIFFSISKIIVKFHTFLVKVTKIKNLSSFFIRNSRCELKVSIRLLQWQFMFHFCLWNEIRIMLWNSMTFVCFQTTNVLSKLRANCKYRTI